MNVFDDFFFALGVDGFNLQLLWSRADLNNYSIKLSGFWRAIFLLLNYN